MKGLLDGGAGLKHRLMRTDAKKIKQYLRSAASPKLHIGGGPRIIQGWLNTDLNRCPGVIAMDATQSFPFDSLSFDYVYSEHMIEHISHQDGELMLRECLRVLRPGGVLRLVTPDLRKLIALAGEQLSDLQQRYLEFFCTTFLESNTPANGVSALNAHFRSWGHTYIYDEQTLQAALAVAGFVDINRQTLNSSNHGAFVGLANDGRYPPGLLEYESLALEGTRPIIP